MPTSQNPPRGPTEQNPDSTAHKRDFPATFPDAVSKRQSKHDDSQQSDKHPKKKYGETGKLQRLPRFKDGSLSNSFPKLLRHMVSVLNLVPASFHNRVMAQLSATTGQINLVIGFPKSPSISSAA
jgi:hypothetical protein